MSDLVTDLHYLAAGMLLMGSAFNDKLVDKAAERIAELEQRLEQKGVTDEEINAKYHKFLADNRMDTRRLSPTGAAMVKKAFRVALSSEDEK